MKTRNYLATSISALVMIALARCADASCSQSYEPWEFDRERARIARIHRVVDGDTIAVDLGHRKEVTIRLAKIDAPEAKQPFGSEAKKYLQGWLDKNGPVFRVQIHKKDRYGRYLGNVYPREVKELSLSSALVASGHAWVYRTYQDDCVLMDYQGAAIENRRGLWKDRNAVPPWVYRKNRRTYGP